MRYSFKPYILVKKRPPSTDVSNEANLCSFSCSFQRSWLGFPEYLTGNTMQWPVLGLCRCVASSCSPSTGSPWTSGWASGLLLFSEIFLSRSSIQPENIAFYKMRICMVWLFGREVQVSLTIFENLRLWHWWKWHGWQSRSDTGCHLQCCYFFKLIMNLVVEYPWLLT